MMKRLLSCLDTLDAVSILFFLLLTAGMIIWSDAIAPWLFFVAANAVMIALILVLSWFAARKASIWKLLHGFYMTLGILLAFKAMYFLVPAINPFDQDATLIAIDHWLFGVHPTQWIDRFSNPLLTEILQICYTSFYLLWIILAVDLYRMGKMDAFKAVFLTIITGFYLSYFGYTAVPAIGPRFTLHDFEKIDEELPGLLLTSHLRSFVNTGESIPPGTENPAEVVQRDCFPSGHTQMTLLVIFLAFAHRARTRAALLVVGVLLITGTVYLRYHYVIDLLAGVVFAAVTLMLVKSFDSYWTGVRARFLERGR